LTDILRGNFPGTELHRVNVECVKDENKGKIINDEYVVQVVNNSFRQINTIASVSGIAALRNTNEHKSSEFVQGMEKLLDSMRGKEYSAIFIADAMPNSTIESICAEYEDIYAQMSPFKQSVQTLNSSESKTDTTSVIEGITDTTNESLAKSLTHGVTHGISRTNTVGGSIGVETKLKLPFAEGGVNVSADYHHSRGTTESTADSNTDSSTTGTAKSISKQNSVANALTSSDGEALQVTFENRSIKTLLDRIDEQIKRLRSCEDFGMFDCCVYFTSNKYENAVAAASTYKSLMRGENSSVEASAVNVWTNENKEDSTVERITQYLSRFYHPIFAIKAGEDFYYPVSAALLVSGKELAYQFSLPKKSVNGIPVIECAEFGRNVMSLDNEYSGIINIGNIYHMHHMESEEVMLNSKDLTAHTFITGSTGAGKSNAIYQLLSELVAKTDATFMVVEPAKGEYKEVFGNNKSIHVQVYGSNPYLTELLRINPFRFPKKTHIYEHLDRLVEIFNVCWPMYAAMPAVLKAALERAYISAGWDLKTSRNITGVDIYPSFASVSREVKRYIEESDYSNENKGNYKGALVTRLESLTNGINGMIFTNDDLSEEELFEQNVIIDLSRIGSMETKALIMGLLIMRLQEYRSGTSKRNSDLKHITVLEEAHNLLRRTSSEQSADNSNLLGKSVEMLANSIAEMRTYGEAFIIADQAPGLLDMSVIRNTNTKIIFRLPDFSDRQLVGKSANLTDHQIIELAKLKTGVAAVYQNNWINPVLCQFPRYEISGHEYLQPNIHDFTDNAPETVLKIIMEPEFRNHMDNVDFEKEVINKIKVSSLSDWLKIQLLNYLVAKNDTEKVIQLAEIAYHFFDAEKILNDVLKAADIQDWEDRVIASIRPSIQAFTDEQVENMIAILTREHFQKDRTYEPIYLGYIEHLCEKREIV